MSENNKDKYLRLRPQIEQGDLILFHGKKVLARVIQESDGNAYFNHVGVVGEIAGALFIIDSNAIGVKPERLSDRIYSYDNGDFAILKPNKTKIEVTQALANLLIKADEKKYKYDFFNGIKAVLNRWFGFKFKTYDDPNRKICSMFVLPYALELDMVKPLDDMNNLFFPQDYIRQSNDVKIIGF